MVWDLLVPDETLLILFRLCFGNTSSSHSPAAYLSIFFFLPQTVPRSLLFFFLIQQLEPLSFVIDLFSLSFLYPFHSFLNQQLCWSSPRVVLMHFDPSWAAAFCIVSVGSRLIHNLWTCLFYLFIYFNGFMVIWLQPTPFFYGCIWLSCISSYFFGHLLICLYVLANYQETCAKFSVSTVNVIGVYC